ncbi:tetratricopeptide repeat protein [Dysgonomonas sp. 520]|uniref:tetratricopeptide repeat protein n=1 Tax=Dysgonomonas sp. 520 TaxID=2302931 RepID=UPI0013D7161F|nr:tetratricopeptide repeat protein [Dysgonomonas sp. 520]NDW10427.1 hypothetical protein [Dysgonomonas sp. 520]
MRNSRTKILVILLLFLGVNTTIYAQKGKKKSSEKKAIPEKVHLSEEERRLFDYYFYEAMNAKSLDNYDSFYDYLRYCYDTDSTNSNVLYELGSFYTMLNNKNKALDYLRKAVAYNPDNYYYGMSLGSLSLEMQQYEESINIFKDLAAKNPDKIDLYLYLSESYRLNKDIPEAVDALNTLEKIVGLNERISLQKYQLYSIMDKKAEAYAEIQKYVDKYPREPKYLILLGNLYMVDKKEKEALTLYEKAKAIDPENPSLVISMADYYEQTGNKEAVEQIMHSALFNQKIDVDTKMGILGQYIGSLQQRNQNTENANALMDSLITQYPQEARINLMYGNLLLLQEKKDDARFQFQLFTDSDPSNPVGWEQLLKTAFPDSIQEAISVCERAISFIPDNPIFYFYLGVSHYIEKDYTKALEALNGGVQYIDEENPYLKSEFYGQMGDLFHQQGNIDSAFVKYEEALKYNPENLGVLNNYSYFLSLQKKDLDRAEKMSSVTIKVEPMNPTYLDTYGWILYEQGAYTMARIYIEKAVKYSEEKKDASSEVYEHYGDVLYKLDEKDKALDYWKKAKEVKEEGDDSETLDKKIETETLVTE